MRDLIVEMAARIADDRIDAGFQPDQRGMAIMMMSAMAMPMIFLLMDRRIKSKPHGQRIKPLCVGDSQVLEIRGVG
jgi:uncharacterized membrane protein (UPF0127 family)